MDIMELGMKWQARNVVMVLVDIFIQTGLHHYALDVHQILIPKLVFQIFLHKQIDVVF
jgi:hypothetical protein